MRFNLSNQSYWKFLKTIKPENDEVLRIKLVHKISTEEIRKIIKESSKNFKAFENWK